jgi:predicted TPR repeat methyltransferase
MRTPAELLADAYARYDASEWDEAGVLLEQALERQPDNARAWYRLGNVREEQRRDHDAATCFERAASLDPGHAKSWNNLGAARQRLGFIEPALQAYRMALSADPALLQPHLNLGRFFESRGELADAAAHYRAALAHHPDNGLLTHLLAAVTGQNTPRAPQGYVAALFDEAAARFDQHLVEDLGYRVPQALARMLRPRLEAPARVMDLGCGTGLVGAALTAPGIELVGVDLAPRMLELAAKRRLYTSLILGDAQEALLQAEAGSFQAVVAADVFIYLGELENVFAAVQRVLAAGGVFAFSIEALQTGRFQLQPTGRYAHALQYVRTVAQSTGLLERECSDTNIRREKQGYARGYLILLERL